MINYIFFVLVGFGILFSLYRIIKGPSPYDRVIGLDIVNVIIIGVLVLIAVINKNEFFLDVAIVYAVLGFLETIVFSKFLEVKS